ncbi:MAG: hypothetical protein KatS3mg085_111 [Candidatus Dojkabacteria bacterium]|nr:MAG: hypothetical protein KatS3mg085_111 [Candidatus Dojkabacteria bacterium]
MKRLSRKPKNVLMSEFIVFKTGFILSNLLVWNFYQILLYRATNDLTIIILEYLIFYLSLWVIFIVGTMILDSAGYLFAMRFMYSMSLIPIIATLLLIDEIGEKYMVIAVLRSIPHGLYWAVHHTFYIKELHGQERSVFINTQKSLELILGIVIPFMVGSLVSFDESYVSLFLLGFLVQLGLFLVPWKYNKLPQNKISSKSILNIVKRKSFLFQGIIFFFDSGINSLFVAIFAIIPFLFLESELGVGSFLSVIGLISALSSYFEAKRSSNFKYKIGLWGYFLRSVFNVVFAALWNFPALFVRSALVVITSSTSDTVKEDLETSTKDLILKDFKSENIEELNIILETIQLFGRIVMLSFTYWLVTNYNPEYIFRLLICIFSFYKFITLISLNLLLEKLKIGFFTRER